MQRTGHKFLLPNTTQTLFTSVKQVVNHVNEILHDSALATMLNFKAEVIVTELLTNAQKHVRETETAVHVYVDGDSICIEKTDHGDPFNPQNILYKKTGPANNKIELSKDAMHCVYAVAESDSSFRFVCEEIDNETPDINAIHEHFGLLIITKAADDFTYYHDRATGANTFSVRLNLY